MYCNITDKYDTDIERLFYQKIQTAIKIDDYREKIKESWKTDKADYIGKLGTIKYEFINYSLHDQTHSQSILQNIYEWLGKERAEKLSIGDLWLLLETAYSHDVGMSTKYIDLEKLWKDEEKITDLINEINLTNDKEVVETLYKIREKSENMDFFKLIKEDKLWPLKVRKAVTYIDATYFRKKHAELSRKHVLSKINFKINDTIPINSCIENRFYNIVADIDYLHTQDDKEIDKLLKIEADGFDTSEFDDDKIHPQMIAYLLRLGDVLDIKNNRFDLWVINYNGGLSHDSKLHYQKHESVRNFLITPQKIEIEINSENIDVCNCANDWLKSIENELQIITRKWNKIAPKQLKGFLMENWLLETKYGNELFSSDDFSKKLTTNSEKLMQLLSGKNIYRTNLVLFREYLQNAIDATKVKYARYYLDNKDFLEYIKPKVYKNIIPSDIQRYDNSEYSFNKVDVDDLAIKINIEPKDELHCVIKIIDNGIGMDNEGLNALFNIGKGWSGRAERKNFKNYPTWLNPTGGFGIGILSGFLLCNQIKIETKTKESYQYIVEVHSPQKNARIIKKINKKYYGIEGTTITFELPYYTFIKEMRKFVVQNHNNNFIDQNFKESYFQINDKTSLLMMIFESVKEIINYYIGSLIFPIKIYSSSLKLEYEYKKNSIFQCALNLGDQIKNNYFHLSYWDEKYNCFLVSNYKNEESLRILYKGIYVNVDLDSLKKEYDMKIDRANQNSNKNKMNFKKKSELIELIRNTFSIIDIHSDTVEDVLEITRDQLRNENDFLDLAYNILYDFLYKIASTDFSEKNILDYYSKKLIEKLLFFYYREVNENIDIFIHLIRRVETPYFLGSISKNKNLDYFNNIENIFRDLDEIYELVDSVLSKEQYGNKKNIKEKINEIRPKCTNTNNKIENILNLIIEENEELYNYLEKMTYILKEISNKKINTRSNNAVITETYNLLKSFVNQYNSDIKKIWNNNHKKYCFLELIFQKKDFSLYCEDIKNIGQSNNKNKFTSQDFLFVDKEEYERIKEVLSENTLYNYNAIDKSNKEDSYLLLNMEYLKETERNSYKNLLKIINRKIEDTVYFLVDEENQLSKLNILAIKDIPDFASNLLEENFYIINPFFINGNIKTEMKNILKILKNKEIRKKELNTHLMNLECFKSTVRYVAEINNKSYSEVESAYVQLLADTFELLD